ncbi:MAG: PVC-type heme-binding CxxCH protein, partial [Limisphaerales bacterium]
MNVTKSSTARARVRIVFSFVSFCLCVSNLFAAEEHDPASEFASFSIASGFHVALFASEEDGVVKPIQIRFDAQGRLWVIGSTVYPQLEPGEVPNDKVLVLEDTDRDGKSDKTTVFADGLMIPTGIELGDGGVYVGHGTELLFLKDTNGDLKADERRVVLRGFGTGDNHQNINSFLWGPGGELWFCQGLHTHSNVETPWGIVRMNQAGLWRFQPKLKKLEGFYGSVHEPQNPWGYVFTDWGEPIVIAGNNSSMIYAVPGLTSRHFSLAPPLIWKNGGGRKSSGADIVGTTHFPEDWQGLVITGGYINNAVWVLEVRDDGSGFALSDREPLIKSTSRNFRPVDVKFGPDGALYICDWYNPIIGHYQASFRHPDRDKTHGRIWRVTAKDRALTTPPQLESASIEELLECLKSKDRWTRQFAKRVLADRNSKEVAAAVEEWRLANGQSNEHALKDVLGVLQSHEIVNEELLVQVSLSLNPGARAYAAGAVGRWAERLKNPQQILQPLARDDHPRVRLHAIVASSYIPRFEALDIAAQAAMLPTDKFMDYALKQTVFALKPHWLAAERLGKFNLSESAERINLLLRTGEASEIASSVSEILNGTGNYEQKLSVGRAVLESGSARDFRTIVELNDAQLRSDLLNQMVQEVRNRKIAPDSKTSEGLKPLIGGKEPGAMRLAGLWQVEAFRGELEVAIQDGRSEAEARSAALEAVGGWRDERARSVLKKASQDAAAPVRVAAIRSMVGVDPSEAANLAVSAEISAEHWREIFMAFLQRQGGATALAAAFREKAPARNVAEIGLRLMNETGRRDEALAKVLTVNGSSKLSVSDIPQLV